MRAIGVVLNVIDGSLTLAVFLENITSCACLERSGLKFAIINREEVYSHWEKGRL